MLRGGLGYGRGLPVEEGHGEECLRFVSGKAHEAGFNGEMEWLEYIGDVEVVQGKVLTATNVPGKKRVVRKAMIFMAELSCLLAAASSLESFERSMLILVSSWAMRLNNYLRRMSVSLGSHF